MYTTAQVHSAPRSARLGIISSSNVNSFSSMRQQITVPAGSTLTLRAWVFPLSQPLDANDAQQIRILDAGGTFTLRQVWDVASNTGSWGQLQFDVSEFLGQTITLYINAINDGAGGVTGMYVDDVELEVCGAAITPTATTTASATPTPNFITATPTPIVVTNTPTPTPTLNVVTATSTPIVVTNTPTPTPTLNVITATATPIVVTNTPTPTPIVVTNTPTPTLNVITATPTPFVVTATPTAIPSTATVTPTYTPVTPSPDGRCVEFLTNPGFEWGHDWYFGPTPLKGGYNGTVVHSGARSALLGLPSDSHPNYDSYSSVRQRVTLPRYPYKTAFLEFWHYTLSNDTGAPLDQIHQELIILDAHSGRTLEVLWRVNRNDGTWELDQFDVTKYLGHAIVVYFNVRNRGGSQQASMYVDDVSLRLCPKGVTVTGGGEPPIVAVSTANFITATPTPGQVTIVAQTTPTVDIPATVSAQLTATTQPMVQTQVTASLSTPVPGSTSLLGRLSIVTCLLALVVALVLLVILVAIVNALRRRGRGGMTTP